MKTSPILIACLLLGGAHGQSFDTRYREVASEMARVAGELAFWCQSNNLLAERDRLYRGALLWDPDDARARRSLGFKKQRDGTWKEPRRPRKSRNRSPRKLPTLREKEKASLDGLVLRALELHDELDRDDPRRPEILSAIVAVHADHEPTRKMLGHVRDGTGWITTTDVARRKRGGALETGEAAIEATSRPEPATLTEAERSSDVRLHAAKTKGVVVLSETSYEEAKAVARACEATRLFARDVLNLRGGFPPSLRVYLVRGDGGVAAVEKIAPEVASVSEGSVGVHWCAEFKRLLVALPKESARRSAAVEFVFGGLLREEFGLTWDHGWAHMGLSVLLTRQLVGAPWISSVHAGPTDGAFVKMFEDPASDWAAEGARLVKYNQVPPLATVLSKTEFDLSQKELFVSALFCRWVIETADDPHKVFGLARTGEPARVAKDGLGKPIGKLQEAFEDWLHHGGTRK